MGELTWLSELPARPPPGPWFGGWAFDPCRPWPGFPAERWILPEVLAWWDGRQPWMAALGPRGTSPAELSRRLDAVEEVEPHVRGIAAQRVNQAPSRSRFEALVSEAVAAIDGGAFSKLVVARELEVEAAEPWPERSILKALEARHKQCWTFLVRGTSGQAFVGASPETLCEVCEDVFCTEALAGTSPAGQGASLLRSEKDRREHAEVVEAIEEVLHASAVSVERPQTPAVKVLANVDHLLTPFRARLRPGVSPLSVARALHPTPAVAGRPQAASVAWLAAHEGFARGWYTGVVGAMGPGQLTLAVALRSAVLDGALARVYVGAGIVRGSEPRAEWAETERKARAVLPALGVHDDG